jgi:hypothetical protein
VKQAHRAVGVGPEPVALVTVIVYSTVSPWYEGLADEDTNT